MNEKDGVTLLQAKTAADELQRIHRLTGLTFDSVPESLIHSADATRQSLAESLFYEAINLWKAEPQSADGSRARK